MIWLSKINKTTLFIVYHFLFFLESPVGIQTLHTNEKEVNFIVVFAGSAILRRFLFSVSNPLVKCKDSFSFPLFLRQCSVARSIELRVGTCHSNPLEATARQIYWRAAKCREGVGSVFNADWVKPTPTWREFQWLETTPQGESIEVNPRTHNTFDVGSSLAPSLHFFIAHNLLHLNSILCTRTVDLILHHQWSMPSIALLLRAMASSNAASAARQTRWTACQLLDLQRLTSLTVLFEPPPCNSSNSSNHLMDQESVASYPAALSFLLVAAATEIDVSSCMTRASYPNRFSWSTW